MARRFQVLLSQGSNNLNGLIRALILDDTTVSKTGKSIERTGYVHDHVSGTFILGYKILVVGYWDGVSVIPLDFSIHREKRDDKLKKSKMQIEKTKNKIGKLQDRMAYISRRIKVLKKEINLLNTAIKTKPQKTKEKQLMTKTQSLEKNKKRMTFVKQDVCGSLRSSLLISRTRNVAICTPVQIALLIPFPYCKDNTAHQNRN